MSLASWRMKARVERICSFGQIALDPAKIRRASIEPYRMGGFTGTSRNRVYRLRQEVAVLMHFCQLAKYSRD
jgi:hypothetical protein